ncbi:diacylglycerol O-acyltransferase 1 [Nowakowskiella sp. JEL0407]|nr:diacylglycerol O-acyltransferase 1 [Nowakowskiella sp. JEL0407]
MSSNDSTVSANIVIQTPLFDKLLSKFLEHIFVSTPFLFFSISIYLTISLFNSQIWIAMLLYLTFIIFDTAPSSGGRKVTGKFSIIRTKIVDNCAKYFPWEIVADGKLNENEGPYLFVCHPHGLWGFGTWMTIAGSTFMEKYPKINAYVATINISFLIPFIRDILLSFGFIPVTKTSIKSILKKGKSYAAAIVVGGAAESLLMKPGTNRLVLNRRKGFVKLAIQTGAHLVPVYSFGETNTYNMYSNAYIAIAQKYIAKILGTPIWTVVGDPVIVEKNQNPSQEEIDALHAKYVSALRTLYAKYRDQYDSDRIEELSFWE